MCPLQRMIKGHHLDLFSPSNIWSRTRIACYCMSDIAVRFNFPQTDISRSQDIMKTDVEIERCCRRPHHHTPVSVDQLSNGTDIEYGSVIREAKHSRALPLYSPINLWLGVLRGIYGRDKSRGRVPRGGKASGVRSHALPGQGRPINESRRKRHPFLWSWRR